MAIALSILAILMIASAVGAAQRVADRRTERMPMDDGTATYLAVERKAAEQRAAERRTVLEAEVADASQSVTQTDRDLEQEQVPMPS